MSGLVAVPLVFLFVVFLLIYDIFFASKEPLIAMYEKQLEPIHIETIPGLKVKRKWFYKGRNYNIDYEITDREPKQKLRILKKRFEENGWVNIEQIRSDRLGYVSYYGMEKKGYYLVFEASKSSLIISIETEVNSKVDRLLGPFPKETEKQNRVR